MGLPNQVPCQKGLLSGNVVVARVGGEAPRRTRGRRGGSVSPAAARARRGDASSVLVVGGYRGMGVNHRLSGLYPPTERVDAPQRASPGRSGKAGAGGGRSRSAVDAGVRRSVSGSPALAAGAASRPGDESGKQGQCGRRRPSRSESRPLAWRSLDPSTHVKQTSRREQDVCWTESRQGLDSGLGRLYLAGAGRSRSQTWRLRT